MRQAMEDVKVEAVRFGIMIERLADITDLLFTDHERATLPCGCPLDSGVHSPH